MLRDTETDTVEVKDEEGNVVDTIVKNKYIQGSAKNYTSDIATILENSYLDGTVTGLQVFQAIAEICDKIFAEEL